LAKAAVWLGSTMIGLTDAQGELKLSLDAWPAQLMIECKGYQIQSFSPKLSAEAVEDLYLEAAQSR
jgi:hypothetical protein